MDKPKKPKRDRSLEWMQEHWDDLDPDNQRKILDLIKRLAAEAALVRGMTPAQRRGHYIRKYARIVAGVVAALAIIAFGAWLASLFD